MVTVRRQNLAADLASEDVSVREAAVERVPTFIREGMAVAGSVLHQWADAEDVVSDSLQHWLEVPTRFNEAHAIPDLAWFKITVRHRALTLLKTRIRQGCMNRQFTTLIDGEDALPEMLELLYLAIKRLPMSDQRVLRTYLSWTDAPSPERAGARLGDALGVPPRKAKQMFAAAKGALRLEIQTLMAHGSHTGGSS